MLQATRGRFVLFLFPTGLSYLRSCMQWNKQLRPCSFRPASNPLTHTPHSESPCFPALRSTSLTASCHHFPVYRNQPGPVGGRHFGDWQPRQRLLVYSPLSSRAATLPRLTRRRTVLARQVQKKKKKKGIKTLLFVQADEWQAEKWGSAAALSPGDSECACVCVCTL